VLGCKDLWERRHLEFLDVERRIILKWILKKWDWKIWTAFIRLKDRDRWRTLDRAVMKSRVP